jgi:predicted amidophosphoribosyltransferase
VWCVWVGRVVHLGWACGAFGLGVWCAWVQAVGVWGHAVGVRQITSSLLGLLFPSECAGCHRPGQAWCSRCAGLLGPPFPVRPDWQPPVYALGHYSGPVRAALLAYKERGHRELAEPFGAAIAAGLRSVADGLAGRPRTPLGSPGATTEKRAPPGFQWGRPPDRSGGPGPPDNGWWLVPAPSRAAQARRRGGDHVVRLAEVAAAELARSGDAAAVAPALRLAAGARDSVGLDAAARVANLAGRIRPRRSGLPPAGTGVVLIDDVFTTGTTVTESVAALWRAGLRPLGVIVLAVADRRAPLRNSGGVASAVCQVPSTPFTGCRR